MPDPRTIRDAFDRAAGNYDRHAALEQEVCRRLLERCEFQRQAPARILDLGCGSGQGSEALKRKYRKSLVIGLDFSLPMLALLRRRSSLLRPLRAVCGDIAKLPLARGSMDLLFSNLAHHWCEPSAAVFDELRRVLRPEGLLLFSALGPGSLVELREAWAEADGPVDARPLPDLIEIGDALVAAGFREPVMDMERITLHYPSLEALALELESTGGWLLLDGWERWRSDRQRLESAYASRLVEGRYPVTYEVVYGTAFGPPEGQPRRTRDGDVATISVDSLLKSRTVR